jgi:hypothetical protein
MDLVLFKLIIDKQPVSPLIKRNKGYITGNCMSADWRSGSVLPQGWGKRATSEGGKEERREKKKKREKEKKRKRGIREVRNMDKYFPDANISIYGHIPYMDPI